MKLILSVLTSINPARRLVLNLKVLFVIVLVGCSNDNRSGLVPIYQETDFKKEKVYYYDKKEFSDFLVYSLKNVGDAGFFLREPELIFTWESGGVKKEPFYSKDKNHKNIGLYHTSIYLSDSQNGGLILGNDENFNAIPLPIRIELTEGDFNSTAGGYPLTELTMDYILFESVIAVIANDNRATVELYYSDYEGKKMEGTDVLNKASFLETNGLGMGSMRGTIIHPEIGELEIIFEKSCGNGRGVGCYGDGTFIFKQTGEKVT